MNKIVLPDNVKTIIDALIGAGYEAYAVGGCVRDSLLLRTPDDWDITTSATPMQVKELFKRTVDTGLQHGTVTVLMGKEGYEVTTYRIDGEYEDGRHPKQVIFTGMLSEDLRRRDFTINAMAYNEKDGIVDLFGGQEDLKRGVIRAVGNAEERFGEDALRIMRAVRFAAQLGYEIDDDTKTAAKKLSGNLQKISAERINTELTKLLLSDHPEQLIEAYRLDITREILPEFDKIMEQEQRNPHHCYSVGIHTVKSICNIEKDEHSKEELKYLRLAMLFHDMGKPVCLITDEDGIQHFHKHPIESEKIAKDILRRLKYDNHTIDAVLKLVRNHDSKVRLTLPGVRHAVNQLGIETMERLFYVQRADILAQAEYKRDEKLQYVKELEDIYNQIKADKDPLFIKDLKIGGNDLISAGLAKGPQIGMILNYLLDVVLTEPSKNDKEILMTLASEKVKQE